MANYKKKIVFLVLFLLFLALSFYLYILYINQVRERELMRGVNLEGSFKLSAKTPNKYIMIDGDLYNDLYQVLSSEKYSKHMGVSFFSNMFIEISGELYLIFDDFILLQRQEYFIAWSFPGIRKRIINKYQSEVTDFPNPEELRNPL